MTPMGDPTDNELRALAETWSSTSKPRTTAARLAGGVILLMARLAEVEAAWEKLASKNLVLVEKRKAAEARAERLQGQLDALANRPPSDAEQVVGDWLDNHGTVSVEVIEQWGELREEIAVAAAAREKLINAHVEMKARAEGLQGQLDQLSSRLGEEKRRFEDLTRAAYGLTADMRLTPTTYQQAIDRVRDLVDNKNEPSALVSSVRELGKSMGVPDGTALEDVPGLAWVRAEGAERDLAGTRSRWASALGLPSSYHGLHNDDSLSTATRKLRDGDHNV